MASPDCNPACRDTEDNFRRGQPLLLEAVEDYQRSTNMLYSMFPKGSLPDEHGDTWSTPRHGRAKANFGRKAWVADLEDPDNCWDRCNVPAEKITIGQGKESYHGWRRAIESFDICLEATRKKDSYAETMMHLENGMVSSIATVMNDFIQDEMINRAGRTVVFSASSPKGFEVNDSLNLPGAPQVDIQDIGLFSYPVLQQYLPQMRYDGWFRHAKQFGAGGAPVYPLYMDHEEAQASVYRDEKYREAHTVGTYNPSELLKGYGVERTLYNFAQMCLEFAPRWSPKPGAKYLDLINDRVDPEIEKEDEDSNMEFGPDYTYNDAYDEAPFEGAFMVLPHKVFELQCPKQLSTAGGKSRFLPTNYEGGLTFLNIRDRDCNPLGTKGFYRADLSMAMKPMNREYLILLIYRRCRDAQTHLCNTGFGEFGGASPQEGFPYQCDCDLCPEGMTGVRSMKELTTDLYSAEFSQEMDVQIGDQVVIRGDKGYIGKFTINGLPKEDKKDFYAKVFPCYYLSPNDPLNLPSDCEKITCVQPCEETCTCVYKWCITKDCGCGCDSKGELNEVSGFWWADGTSNSMTELLGGATFNLPADAAALQLALQAAMDTVQAGSIVTVVSDEDGGYSTVEITDAPAGAAELQFGPAGCYKKLPAKRCCVEDPLSVLCTYTACAPEGVTGLANAKGNKIAGVTLSLSEYLVGDAATLQADLQLWIDANVPGGGTAVVTVVDDKLKIELVDVAAQLKVAGVLSGKVCTDFDVKCLGQAEAPAAKVAAKTVAPIGEATPKK